MFALFNQCQPLFLSRKTEVCFSLNTVFKNVSQSPSAGAPSIELKEFMEVEQGSDISIVAKIRGCPFPTLTWYKAPPHKSDDKVEVQYDEHINKIVSDDSCTLLIQQGKRPDTGLYTLMASNSLGKASKEMRLNVLGTKRNYQDKDAAFSGLID